MFNKIFIIFAAVIYATQAALGPRTYTATNTLAGMTFEIKVTAGYGNSGETKDGVTVTLTAPNLENYIAIGFRESAPAENENAMTDAISLYCLAGSSNPPVQQKLGAGTSGSAIDPAISTTMAECNTGTGVLKWAIDGYAFSEYTFDPTKQIFIIAARAGSPTFTYHGPGDARGKGSFDYTCSGECTEKVETTTVAPMTTTKADMTTTKADDMTTTKANNMTTAKPETTISMGTTTKAQDMTTTAGTAPAPTNAATKNNSYIFIIGLISLFLILCL